MVHTACIVCLIITVRGAAKKAKNTVLVAGTQQNLSNLDFLKISMAKTRLGFCHRYLKNLSSMYTRL